MNINLAFGSTEQDVSFAISARKFSDGRIELETKTQGVLVSSDATNSTQGESASYVGVANPSAGTRSTTNGSKLVTVNVSSRAKTVTISMKPTVIARELRQERLNSLIRFGFAPTSYPTDK